MARLRVFKPHEEVRLAYSDARRLVRSGDILLWRPTTLLGRLIAWGTGAAYSHASMAVWEPNGERNPNRRIRNVEVVQWHGGQNPPLAPLVDKHPGKIDLFRPLKPYDGDKAALWMLFLCSRRYGWFTFLMMFLLRVRKWVLPAPADSPDMDLPRVCSVAVAWAANYGGGHKVDTGKSDFLVFPGELSEPFSRYLGTLYPDEAEARDVAA